MVTYILVIILVTCITAFYKDAAVTTDTSCLPLSRQNINALISTLVAIILIVTAGLRYNAGADYFSYATLYKSYVADELSITKEPIIRIIARIAYLLYDHYGTMMFIASFVTIGLYYVTVVKQTPWLLISSLLFIFLGCWHESFNSIRQSLAAAILFFGHRYILENKFKKWFITALLAAMAHVSAIPFVLLYFCKLRKLSFKWIVIYVILALIALASYDYAWRVISFLQQETFTVDTYSTSPISIFRLLVAWMPITFYFLFKSKYLNKQFHPEVFNYYLSMSLLNASIMLASISSAYLGRLCIYTDVYNVITWAYLLRIFRYSQQYIYIPLSVLLAYSLYWYCEASGPYLKNFEWIIFK